MKVIDKNRLKLKLGEFKTFMESAVAKSANPAIISEAGLLIERFNQFLAMDGYFETEFQDMLNKMATIKSKIEKPSADFIHAASQFHNNTTEK